MQYMRRMCTHGSILMLDLSDGVFFLCGLAMVSGYCGVRLVYFCSKVEREAPDKLYEPVHEGRFWVFGAELAAKLGANLRAWWHARGSLSTLRALKMGVATCLLRGARQHYVGRRDRRCAAESRREKFVKWHLQLMLREVMLTRADLLPPHFLLAA